MCKRYKPYSIIAAPFCFLILFTMLLRPAGAEASEGAPVRHLSEQKLWVLETARTSYVLGVNERGELQHVYWGKKLVRDGDLVAPPSSPDHASFDSRETLTNFEYPGWGGRLYNEPCLKVTGPTACETWCSSMRRTKFMGTLSTSM